MSSAVCWAACRPCVSRATRCCGDLNVLGSATSLSRQRIAHRAASSYSNAGPGPIPRRSAACSALPARFCLGRRRLTHRGGNQPPPNCGGTGSGGWGDGGAFGTSRVLCALASAPPSTSKEDVILLDVADMMCGGCVSRVRRVLEGHEAVTAASVNLATETALVRVVIADVHAEKSHEGALQTISGELAALLSAAGFGATVRDSSAPASAAAATILRKRDERAQRLADSTTRLILSWTLAITCFAGHLLHCWPGIFYAPAAIRMLASPALHAALSVATLIGPGRAILMDGGVALFKGRPDMNSLVALGALSALGVSAVAAAVPALGWKTFFEEPAMLLSVVLLGRTLEERAKLQASADMVALYDLLPSQARLVLSSNTTVDVPADAVSKGDHIRVLPGDRLPVDGVVVSGRTTVDEAALTGEPMPVVKSAGELVTAGTVNVDGVITVRSEASGGETAIADIVRSVEGAQARTAPVQRAADAVAGRFAFAVMGLSAATFTFWTTAGASMFPSVIASATAGTSAAGAVAGSGAALLLPLQLACNVLVVACPCALGLATPTAVLVGTSAAAKRGLLVRGGDVIERMSKVDTVVFDKTGTLTEGKPSVVEVKVVASGDREEEVQLLAWAAAVEGGSTHPLARAVVSEGTRRGVETLEVEEGTLSQVPGLGIAGVVSGTPVAVGNAEWLVSNGVHVPQATAASTPVQPGATRVFVAAGGTIRGHIDFIDKVRPGAREALKALQEHGMRTVMLTGDAKGPAEAVGAAVGIVAGDVFSGVKPEGKLFRVEELQGGGGTVAMVGDGINDASALAAADVGIAMAGGVQAAGEVADVVLLRDCPTQVVEAFSVSRATLQKIRENLFWAFGYNLVGVPVAAGALLPSFGIMLSPSISGALMGLSSLAVMGNSLLLRREATRKIIDWTPPLPEAIESTGNGSKGSAGGTVTGSGAA